eukprot:gene34819-44640_t
MRWSLRASSRAREDGVWLASLQKSSPATRSAREQSLRQAHPRQADAGVTRLFLRKVMLVERPQRRRGLVAAPQRVETRCSPYRSSQF